MPNPASPSPQQPSRSIVHAPGLFRRLAAITYDLFLLIGVLFIATAIALPFNSGNAFTSKQLGYAIYLGLVSFFFFGWFWTHGGQTLGLKTWKIKVMSINQTPLTWRQSALRFIAALLSWACLGLGFLWILVDRQNRGWHDYLSQSAVFFDSDAS